MVFLVTERYSREAISYVTTHRARLHLVPTPVFVMALTALKSGFGPGEFRPGPRHAPRRI